MPQRSLIELTNAAMALPCMQNNRDAVVRLLESRIGNSIPRGRDTRADVLAIVETCLHYDVGLREFLEAAAFFDTGTTAYRDFLAVLGGSAVSVDPAPSRNATRAAEGSARPSRSLRVFLCHGQKDGPAVRALRGRLMADGFEPWLDEEEILPGQNRKRTIARAVQASDIVLVCLSQDSASEDGLLRKELGEALDTADEKSADTIFLIPVRLEECIVPERLRDWHWVNLFEPAGYDRLLRALHVRAREPGTAAAAQSGSAGAPGVPEPVADRQMLSDARDPAPASRTPTPGAQDHLRINATDGAEMALIPAGAFLMGDPDSPYPAEKPAHQVFLDAYWIYTRPVTVAQYEQFCRAQAREMPEAPSLNRDWQEKGHPIVNVNWRDARDYCSWAGVRLPSEAQWEKAARGPEGHAYPWGDEWDSSKCANSVPPAKCGGTVQVGLFPANGCGLYDMTGNVWEWCEDWFDGSYYKTSPNTNPVNVRDMTGRVLRGGSWYNYTSLYFRASHRYSYAPDKRYDNVGFRCVVQHS